MGMCIGQYHAAKITLTLRSFTVTHHGFAQLPKLMKTLKGFLKSKGYVSIPLTLTATNHFEVEAKINGIPGRFIVDTGASNTCIGVDKIDWFGLTTKSTDIKAAGAGSSEMEALISTNNSIAIDGWEKKRQRIVLIDLFHVNHALENHDASPVHGIIGADILKKGRAIIDYNRKQLFLFR